MLDERDLEICYIYNSVHTGKVHYKILKDRLHAMYSLP